MSEKPSTSTLTLTLDDTAVIEIVAAHFGVEPDRIAVAVTHDAGIDRFTLEVDLPLDRLSDKPNATAKPKRGGSQS